MKRSTRSNGFTLVELMVVMAIAAILIAVAMPAYRMAIQHAHSTGCCSNMRQLGIAFLAYAGDNGGQLPSRVEGTGSDKWPVLLLPYVADVRTYVDPGDPIATKVPANLLASNDANNSSFFFNGFNDLGFYSNPNATVSLVSLTDSSNLLLLGQKVNGNTQYYMDFVEGNQDDILNKASYFNGSNYCFADGSAMYIPAAKYADTMWLVDKSYPIPAIPAGH